MLALIRREDDEHFDERVKPRVRPLLARLVDIAAHRLGVALCCYGSCPISAFPELIHFVGRRLTKSWIATFQCSDHGGDIWKVFVSGNPRASPNIPTQLIGIAFSSGGSFCSWSARSYWVSRSCLLASSPSRYFPRRRADRVRGDQDRRCTAAERTDGRRRA
jgi:hypothetical protein